MKNWLWHEPFECDTCERMAQLDALHKLTGFHPVLSMILASPVTNISRLFIEVLQSPNYGAKISIAAEQFPNFGGNVIVIVFV
jgi:hypothetical protein